ncbi:hypothetical protein B296_00044064 [Ensete ventricosum]|uniref:Uncharacterized protein n=1 Tax=Ensete ventricosum TaxID=4639 RepID=A0A426ZCD7_ENSVE|nr:hypothetical protein B296_00044064 [Ensete ventricosum]
MRVDFPPWEDGDPTGGHRYHPPRGRCHTMRGQLLLIEPIDDSKHEEKDLEHEDEVMEEDPQPTDCIVQTLVGYANPQAMKVGGFLKQQPITILIDNGSTNNFMNSKVVARMVLYIEDCRRFDVKVANASAIEDARA